MSDSATPWTVAHKAPLSMGFPRLEYWSGLPFPTPGDLPDSGIEPMSPALSGGFFTTDPPEKPRVAEQFFSGKQRRLIGKERHVENDRMCACWGDTAIFNRMVRQ